MAHEAPDADHPVRCDWCGRAGADAVDTLAWTTAVENGRSVTFCQPCSREHLRAIEGKLDSELW